LLAQARIGVAFSVFKNEICGFDAIAKDDGVKVTSEELKLGRGLIEKMSSAHFEPQRYADQLSRGRTPYD